MLFYLITTLLFAILAGTGMDQSQSPNLPTELPTDGLIKNCPGYLIDVFGIESPDFIKDKLQRRAHDCSSESKERFLDRPNSPQKPLH